MTKEEEKYGNDGDKFNRIGRGVIGGVEKVSSMLSSALSVNTRFIRFSKRDIYAYNKKSKLNIDTLIDVNRTK